MSAETLSPLNVPIESFKSICQHHLHTFTHRHTHPEAHKFTGCKLKDIIATPINSDNKRKTVIEAHSWDRHARVFITHWKLWTLHTTKHDTNLFLDKIIVCFDVFCGLQQGRNGAPWRRKTPSKRTSEAEVDKNPISRHLKSWHLSWLPCLWPLHLRLNKGGWWDFQHFCSCVQFGPRSIHRITCKCMSVQQFCVAHKDKKQETLSQLGSREMNKWNPTLCMSSFQVAFALNGSKPSCLWRTF